MKQQTILAAGLALIVGVVIGAATRTRKADSPQKPSRSAPASSTAGEAAVPVRGGADETREAQFLQNRVSSERLHEANRSLLARLLSLLRSGQDDEAFDLISQWGSGPAELSREDIAALIDASRGGHSAKLRQRLLFLLFQCAKDSIRELIADLAVRETDVVVRRSAIQVAAYLGGPEMRSGLETGIREVALALPGGGLGKADWIVGLRHAQVELRDLGGSDPYRSGQRRSLEIRSAAGIRPRAPGRRVPPPR
jgi:hypothetical protein